MLSDYEAPIEVQTEGVKEEGGGDGRTPDEEEEEVEDTSAPTTWWEDRERGVASEGGGEGRSEVEERVVGAVMATLEREVGGSEDEEEGEEEWGRGAWKRKREEEGEGEETKRPRLEEGVVVKEVTGVEGGPTVKRRMRRKRKGKQKAAYHPPQWQQNQGVSCGMSSSRSQAFQLFSSLGRD